ncbi:MAG TPA: sigma-70 family RNA polymerase sigma factor [Allocoleopsis sp.]
MLVSIGARVVYQPPSVDNATLLAEYARTGSKQARDRLVLQNIGLVRKYAHELHEKSGHPYEDLEQVGCLGLLQAIDRFELSAGYKLSSFAVPYIRGEINHYLRDRGNLIRANRRWHYMIATENRVRRELGAIATNEAVRKRLGLSPQEWQEFQLFKRNRSLMALDMRLSENGDTLEDLIPDWRSPADPKLELNLLLEKLEPERREAIAFIHLQELSHREAAAKVGCSGRAIARRAKQALEQLQAMCG